MSHPVQVHHLPAWASFLTILSHISPTFLNFCSSAKLNLILKCFSMASTSSMWFSESHSLTSRAVDSYFSWIEGLLNAAHMMRFTSASTCSLVWVINYFVRIKVLCSLNICSSNSHLPLSGVNPICA